MLKTQAGPVDKSLASQWQGVAVAPRRLRDGIPLWVVAAALALLLMFVFIGLRLSMNAQTDDTFHALQSLGASAIINRADLASAGKPFQKERWAAVVDAVGSHTLANALAQTRYGGVVAACGLAQGMDLPTTVMPFILRGVTLAGIDSVMAPLAKRQRAWDRLARDLDPALLERMIEEIPLEGAIAKAQDLMAGKVRGRVVVRVQP
jgi:putative YhdH/YhfP family quinone oxidoreductase